MLRAETDQPRDDLGANVQRRTGHLEDVHLVHQNRRKHAEDDLVPLLDLGQRIVERVEIGRSDQGGSLEQRTPKLEGRPEAGQIVVPDEKPGHHRELSGLG